MNDPIEEEEMIAELEQRQSDQIKEINDESDDFDADHPSGLNLDPITEEEIEAIENAPTPPPSPSSEPILTPTRHCVLEPALRNSQTRGVGVEGGRGQEDGPNPHSKFNADGYNKILRAKEEGKLIEFASVLPPQENVLRYWRQKPG